MIKPRPSVYVLEINFYMHNIYSSPLGFTNLLPSLQLAPLPSWGRRKNDSLSEEHAYSRPSRPIIGWETTSFFFFLRYFFKLVEFEKCWETCLGKQNIFVLLLSFVSLESLNKLLKHVSLHLFTINHIVCHQTYVDWTQNEPCCVEGYMRLYFTWTINKTLFLNFSAGVIGLPYFMSKQNNWITRL